MKRMRYGWLGLTVFWATLTSAQSGDTGMFIYQEAETHQAQVQIDTGRKSPYVVEKNLFGKFTENLGHNIYHGFWAQLLENPSLEPVKDCKMSGAYSEGELNFLRQIAGPEALLPGDEKQIGFYWLRWNGSPDNYSLDPDAWNTNYSQRIQVRQFPEGASGVGVRQPVYFPVHRVKDYELSFYVRRANAPLIIQVSDPSDPQRIFARVELKTGDPTRWERLETMLSLDITPDYQGKPLWFCIGLKDAGEMLLDQIMLFPADAIEGFDPEVLQWVKDSRIRLLRFPGGNYVSGYHWKDDLVPMDKRPTKPNPAWNQVDPHHVGIDEHLAYCRLIGAEPLICINAGDGTVQDAADLVEYCNGSVETRWGRIRAERGHPEPYRVRMWEVGNELWGDWQIGHCTPEEYARRYREFYQAMKAVDPSIYLIACGHHEWYWNEPLLEQNADILHSLSVHFLLPNNRDGSGEYTFLSQMGYTWLFEDLFRRFHDEGKKKGIDLKVAVTELIEFNPRAYQANPLALSEALYYAGTVLAAIRSEGIAELITHTALLNHGGGLAKERAIVYPHPVYYAHAELQRLEGTQPLAFEVVCPFSDIPEWQGWAGNEPRRFPLIDLMPLEKDDSLDIVILNKHDDLTIPLEIEIANARFENEATCYILTGASFTARNTANQPDRVKPEYRQIPVVEGRKMSLETLPSSLYVLTLKKID